MVKSLIIPGFQKKGPKKKARLRTLAFGEGSISVLSMFFSQYFYEDIVNFVYTTKKFQLKETVLLVQFTVECC